MGILDIISNPRVADIPGAQQRGRESAQFGINNQINQAGALQRLQQGRQQQNAQQLAGGILGGQFAEGSQQQQLASASPELALQVFSAAGIPTNAQGLQQEFAKGLQLANQFAQSGNTDGAVSVINQLKSTFQRNGLDTSTIDGLMEQAQSNPELIPGMVSVFEGSGIIQGPDQVSAKDQAATEKLRAETENIRATGAGNPAQDRRKDAKLIAETNKLVAETEKLRRATNSPVVKLSDDEKENVKINAKRIGELSQTQRSRELSIKKAKTFLNAFKDGEATSGATRTLLDFIPGSFTKQSEFDQKFNAFAEVAARQKLKSSGETKPTDADVEGMKRAIFGLGRDEAVNIDLLSEFILEQEASNDELLALNKARRQGNLPSFSGGQELPKTQRIRFDEQGNQIQ